MKKEGGKEGGRKRRREGVRQGAKERERVGEKDGGREAVLSLHHKYKRLLILPIRIGVSGSESFMLHKSADNLPRHCAAKNIPIPFIDCKCYIQTKMLLQKSLGVAIEHNKWHTV